MILRVSLAKLLSRSDHQLLFGISVVKQPTY
jgi:hypothetical protein